MSFFEPPAVPSQPEPAPFGPWMGPPSNVLGTVVPLRLVLCRSADAVVAVNGVVAYPTGAR